MSIQPVHLRSELRALVDQIYALPLVLVAAPAGSGKTTLLSDWRDEIEARGAATAWIDLAPLHADLGSFIEELAIEIERAAPCESGQDRFGAALLRQLPRYDELDAHTHARLLGRELAELAEPLVLFLDNYHRLPVGSTVDAVLSQALRDAVPQLHLVVATRGSRPNVATRMLAEGRAFELGPEDLNLRAEQVQQILSDRGVTLDELALPRLLAQTRGWATGVLLAGRVLAEGRAEDTDRFIGELASHDDLFSYVASELLVGESEAMLQLLENAALLGSVERGVLEASVGAGAAEHIDAALGKGLLLRTRGRVGLHHLWEALLRDRMRRRLSIAELQTAVGHAVRKLDEMGDDQRGIELCIEFSQTDLALGMIERHGLEWMERGLHDNVSRWLAAVPPPARASPELLLVRALLEGRKDVARAIDALEAVADRFRAIGDTDREMAARHNAIILAVNQNLEARARNGVLKIIGLRRIVRSPQARSTALLFMGMGAALTGRFGLARRLTDRIARHDFSPRERGALGIGRMQIAMLMGDWERAVAIADDNLADPDQRSHGPSFFSLRAFRTMSRAVLGLDIEDAIEQLTEARQVFRELRLAVSEAEISAFMGRLLAKLGRQEEARDAFEWAVRVFEELDVSEGLANAHVLLAEVHRELGNREAALRYAGATIAAFDRVRKGSLRRRAWIGALAARVLAEEGEMEAAEGFLKRHARTLDTPDLPGSQQVTQLALARIADLAGDDERARGHLQRAETVVATADLRVAHPDLDAELLRWSSRAARKFGLETRTFDRFDPSIDPAEPAAPALRIVSFGTFRVETDGRAIPTAAWRGALSQRLLQRLLIAGERPLSREQLTVDFWPDASVAAGRGNLRVALTRLRHALEPGRTPGDPEKWLQIEGDHIGIRRQALESWDVTEWLSWLDRAQPCEDEVSLDFACRVVRAYRGPVFPDTLDDWALAHRAEIERRFARVATASAEALLERERVDEADEMADCLLVQDPADERAWCLRVRAEAARGDRRAAIRAIDQARDALERELGVEPGSELRALRLQLGV